MASLYLDPNRPLPRLLGRGLDAIVEKKGRHTWPVDPTDGQRRRRYQDALCHVDVEPNHEKRETTGALLQDRLRTTGRLFPRPRPKAAQIDESRVLKLRFPRRG